MAGLKTGTWLTAQVVRTNRTHAIINKLFSTTSVDQQTAAGNTAEAELESELSSAKPFSEIPGPRTFPLVGSLPSMLFDKDFDIKKPDRYWEKVIKTHGEILKFTIPGMPDLVIVTNPDDAEKISRHTMDNPVRTGFFSLAKVRRESVDNYFENKGGLLIENDEEWWRVRSRVQTPMMKPKNVASYLTQMDQVTLEFTDRISSLQKQHGEMPEDFQMELYKWALESVSLVALNRRMGCLDPNLPSDSEPLRLIRIVQTVMESLSETEIGNQLWKIYPTKAFRNLKKSHAEFLQIADQNIRQTEAQLLAKRQTQEISNDEDLTLMETLLLTDGLSRKDVITLILDMLFAGIDTTAHTLGFTLYLLARNPESQAKLQEELDNVIGDYEGPLTAKHLARLSYLKAVVKESLRIFPLAMGFIRTLQKDVVLCGHLIPKGVAASSFNMFIAKDEKYFPRAKEFIPDRWLRHRPLGPIHPFASLPFSVGTRMCIGRRIAEQEIYTFLARVMHRYSVDYKYQDMDYKFRLVFTPSEPLRFSFTERR